MYNISFNYDNYDEDIEDKQTRKITFYGGMKV